MAFRELYQGIQGDWRVTAQDGTQIAFTSFISLEYTSAGRVNEEALEQGTFTSYNKSEASADAVVTLGLSYEYGADIPVTLRILAEWKSQPILLTVVTPEHVLQNFTLERFSYSRQAEDGVGVIFIELGLKEIRQVGNVELAGGGLSTVAVKNPSNASTIDRGTVSAQKDESLLASLGF